MVSEINKRLTLSGNYVNLFEVASSGTQNISVRNPVYDMALLHHFGNDKHRFEQKLETGFSQRHWLHSELENEMADSTSNDTKGMFFELENKYSKKD